MKRQRDKALRVVLSACGGQKLGLQVCGSTRDRVDTTGSHHKVPTSDSVSHFRKIDVVPPEPRHSPTSFWSTQQDECKVTLLLRPARKILSVTVVD